MKAASSSSSVRMSRTGRNPVAATGLRPVIDILTDEAELAAFIDPYAAALADAYPRSPAGVLFPFRRVFAVARRTPPPPSA